MSGLLDARENGTQPSAQRRHRIPHSLSWI